MPKSLIERNNTIVVNEINTFRLIYKLMEKVKRNMPREEVLVGLLGNEVIRKVTALRNCFQNGVNEYGLSMIESYMNERSNQSIKKYKSVVMEYFKKYTSEIEYEYELTLNSSIDT
jgi:hypothetical protein